MIPASLPTTIEIHPRCSAQKRPYAAWFIKLLLFLVLAFAVVPRAQAFAVLGPFEPWMDLTNGHRMPGDIGGALDISEEYRWNVPVVTYGFDQSFLDYFGSNGVAAVEKAIQILNALPGASSLYLSNFLFEPSQFNYLAEAQGLQDVKSVTLTVLLEQMGLAEPTRHVFDLRRWDPLFILNSNESTWGTELFPYFILERNYDPETLEASHYVNGTLFTGFVHAYPPLVPSPPQATIVEVNVDPLANAFTAVRDNRSFNAGEFVTGLSRDDAGGLRYLLSSNNINFETLLPDVHGINGGLFVNGAFRPGVEKITFTPHPYDDLLGQFLTSTNQYPDTYITNGVAMSQSLERVTCQPDFLFCAADTGANEPYTPLYTRSGTSNWCNNAALNGDPTKAGPGLIRPRVKITFNEEGQRKYTTDYADTDPAMDASIRWASFDGSTNNPVTFPASQLTNVSYLTVRLRILPPSLSGTSGFSRTWSVPVPFGGNAILQTSTNLASWVTVATVQNRGSLVEWLHYHSKPQRFFRVAPQ